MNQINENLKGNHTLDVDELIGRMQKEDSRNKRMMKSVFLIYLFCGIFYSGLFIVNPDPDLTIYDRIGGLCYVTAFITGAYFFRKEYQNLKNAGYTLPLLDLLTKQEERYRFYAWKRWFYILVILVLIACGISSSFMNPNRLIQFTAIEKLVIVQGVYWSVMVAAGFLGYRLWKKRSYPVWKDIKDLLHELGR